jgi:hypothetical protein
MANRIIIGAVLFAAGIGIGATTQPAGTIQELRARRAELEKTIAAATAELRTVNAAIAKLGKADVFPISHLEEAKARLSAVQYEQAKAMKFGGVAIANPERQTWSEGVWVRVTGPRGDGMKARCRALGKDPGGQWRVVETEGNFGIGDKGMVSIGHAPLQNAWLQHCSGGQPQNLHVLITLAGMPIYEAVWKSEKAPVAPNGVAWYRDESLVVRFRERAMPR